MGRLKMAFVAYAVLAALAFTTLNDPRIRGACLLVLGLFAVKTWVRRKDVMHSDGIGESEPESSTEGRSPMADAGLGPM
jgi:hypothetical protein